MVANFEDKPAKLEFSRSLWERLLKIHIYRCINSNDSTVKFNVQDSRFKVQDSKLNLVKGRLLKR